MVKKLGATIGFNLTLITFTVFACLMRFIGLNEVPNGFYVDEAFGAAHSLSYANSFHDFYGKIALFSQIENVSYQSAPFLVLSAIWTKVFGTDAAGFRSFTAMIGIMIVVGIYYLVKNLFQGNLKQKKDMALLAAFFTSLLPWAFHFSRISWDAPLGVCFLVWGLSQIYSRGVLGTVLIALASYTYPPMRIQAMLMLFLLPEIKMKNRFFIFLIFGIMMIPVIPYNLDPQFLVRSKLLAINSDYRGNPYLGADFFSLILAYVKNLGLHLSPAFLLFRGDANLRHGTGTVGVLDFMTGLGCAFAIILFTTSFLKEKIKPSLLLKLSMIGIFAGITPAALTWEGVPHAIRSLGAFPFFAILSAMGFAKFFQLIRAQKMKWVMVSVSVLLFLSYLSDYFTRYKEVSYLWFDGPIIQKIIEHRVYPEHYGELGKAYYELRNSL